MKKSLTLITALTLLILVISPASADTTHLDVHYTDNPPSIDGEMMENEWENEPSPPWSLFTDLSDLTMEYSEEWFFVHVSLEEKNVPKDGSFVIFQFSDEGPGLAFLSNGTARYAEFNGSWSILPGYELNATTAFNESEDLFEIKIGLEHISRTEEHPPVHIYYGEFYDYNGRVELNPSEQEFHGALNFTEKDRSDRRYIGVVYAVVALGVVTAVALVTIIRWKEKK